MAKADFKIFKTNRIKFSELYEDAMAHIKAIYYTKGEEFTMASPFAQLLNVVLHLGRMILFYIENTITELNIKTAYHPRSIQGLATLTGHIPSTGMAARGTLFMSYKNGSEYAGTNITIKNFTKIRNTANSLPYMLILPADIMQLTAGAYDSKIELSIIQGEVKYQNATGTGLPLQSFNFANKNNVAVDNFFVNIYVNGEHWESVTSLIDMTYWQKACIVRNSLDRGGIDVFFGTGNNGAIPEEGASITCEYIITSGYAGNIMSEEVDNYWIFDDSGYDANGDYVDLNSVYNLTSGSDILFGAYGESLEMTRMLAPHMSRNFVLANEVNYKTFLSKLNLFSKIHVFSGFNTYEDNKIETEYTNAKLVYASLKESYLAQVNLTGKNSKAATDLYEKVSNAKITMDALKVKNDDAKLDDNVIYMYLIPDITKRIGSNENYFTCSQSYFKLTTDEKEGIINLIENSGQKMLTVDNRIVDPIFVRFAVNIFVQIWSEYDFPAVKGEIISAISDYLIKNTRQDRIPLSDIVRVVEGIEGVDSVTAYFDADKNNAVYYGENNYGIDEYGDIVLTRTLQDTMGNNVCTKDLYPLFRGPFTSCEGIDYEDSINALVSPINITLRGKTEKTI